MEKIIKDIGSFLNEYKLTISSNIMEWLEQQKKYCNLKN